jgi:hypothetical protein
LAVKQTWGDIFKIAEKQGACCPECWAAGYLAAPTLWLGAFIRGVFVGAGAVIIVVWS